MILVPLFDLKFLKRSCGRWCRNLKSAALEPVCGPPAVRAIWRRSRKRNVAQITQAFGNHVLVQPTLLPGRLRGRRGGSHAGTGRGAGVRQRGCGGGGGGGRRNSGRAAACRRRAPLRGAGGG